MSPVGPRMKIEIDCGGVLDFENSTHESAMALAVSALICAFISVRFATSFETVTFDSGAGLAPCAHAPALTNMNAAAKTFLIICFSFARWDDLKTVPYLPSLPYL